MDKIEEMLTRGVENIYPTKAALEEVLRSNKKIRLYNGIDPTGPQLHLGHMVVLKKLRQFQNLGHHIILLLGDFTGMIGDPSGKSEARKPLSREQLLENAKNYKNQASKILRFEGENPVEIKYNSEWLDNLSYPEIIKLTSLVTYSQVIERDMFQKRVQEGKDLFVNELLYPLVQGYDSVAMDVDLEIGGSDQTFNMLMGRTLMKKIKGKEKYVLTTKLLAEPGKEKMGKTTGNLICLDEKPSEMFGKIMSWPDEMLEIGFELLTDVAPEEVKQSLNDPLNLKKRLAEDLVRQLHSQEEAIRARVEFERVHQQRENAEDLAISISENIASKDAAGTVNLVDVLYNGNITPSKSSAKNLIEQGAIDVDNKTVTDVNTRIKAPVNIKVGKKKFVKFVPVN
ncbi:MAG: tyrosine--tRNA ligase [bacterium]|nr:tyrosine--tRNA ligase [bacterium]